MNSISKMNRTFNPISAERKLADINVEPDIMKEVLVTIAQEVQQYHKPPESIYEIKSRHDDLLKELNVCKASLRSKKIHIKFLRKNRKSAYVMTKKCMLTNNKEIRTLYNQVNEAKEENIKLKKRNKDNIELIEKLTADYQVLKEKIENITNFIDLGYKELQKLQNGSVLLSIAEKLKHIMVSCGEYYANYCNEHEKCSQLEQRNRFLTNKLQITENNLAATNNKLTNLQTLQSVKGKHLYLVKDKKTKVQNKNALGVGSECSVIDKQSDSYRFNNYNVEFVNKENFFHTSAFDDLMNMDLSSHVNLVKNLLDDQDSMLKDLKQIKEELNST